MYFINYMGSKQSLAPSISNIICNRSRGRHVIVDCCFGGGAVGYQLMLDVPNSVLYGFDIYAPIITLHKAMIGGLFTNADFTYFVSRAEFFESLEKLKNGTYNHIDAMRQVIWSFGNRGDSYIFGQDIEDFKRQYHNFVVSPFDNMEWLFCYLGITDKTEQATIIDNIRRIQNRHRGHDLLQESKSILKELNKIKSYCYGLAKKQARKLYKADLTAIDFTKARKQANIDNLEQLQRLQRLQHLERLQQLQRLQRLQHLERLEHSKINLSAKSMFDIDFNAFEATDTIIYFDPPYKNTAGYYNSSFDFDKFDALLVALNSKGFHIYVSEYDNRFINLGFREVWRTDKICKMGAGNRKDTTELLFFNG